MDIKKNGKLILDIQGGLGNQLFQLFTMFNLSKQYNMDVYVPDKKKLVPGRPIDVERNTYYKLFKNLNMIPVNNMIGDVIQETSFKYTPIILDNKRDYIIRGFYQSLGYFNQNISILDYLTIPLEDLNRIDNMMAEIKTLNKVTISLHVRRSEELKIKSGFHHMLDVSYYKNALKILKDRGINTDDALFLIFTEDYNWCDENLNFVKNKIFFTEKDYVELMLMSKCDHNIIANSTFSWWGAYLNKNNKIVIYPSVWFAESANINVSELFPTSWIKCNE